MQNLHFGQLTFCYARI